MNDWSEDQVRAVIIGLKRNNRKLQRKVKKLESFIEDQRVEDDLASESSEDEETISIQTSENEHIKEVEHDSKWGEITVDFVLGAGAIIGILFTSWIVCFIKILTLLISS